MSLDERQLIERARTGDVEAFELLARGFQDRLFRLILAAVGAREDAEDALQETLVRAYRAFPSFRGDSSLSTWLHRIALTVSRNWLRSETRACSERIARRLARVGADTPPAPEERLLATERRETIRRAVAGLPDHYREALLLRHYQDMAYDQIAEILSIPVGTVRSRLAQGRLLLTERLHALGYFDEREQE